MLPVITQGSMLNTQSSMWISQRSMNCDSYPKYPVVQNAPWASFQICKVAGCACAGNAGNVFPRDRLQIKPLVSDPNMHHGTCVTHVPWCMSGSLTRGRGENVPGIPGACASAILRIWQEAHGLIFSKWAKWAKMEQVYKKWTTWARIRASEARLAVYVTFYFPRNIKKYMYRTYFRLSLIYIYLHFRP